MERKIMDRKSESEICSVLSDSLRPHRLYSPGLKFSRPEYWSGLPFPSPGDLPSPEIKPRSSTLQADSLPTELSGKPLYGYEAILIIHGSAAL